jgi:hypothetical protein
MIPVVHPGSRIRMLTFSHPGSRIPDPGVKKAPNPGSRIRIRNTDIGRQCKEVKNQRNSPPPSAYGVDTRNYESHCLQERYGTGGTVRTHLMNSMLSLFLTRTVQANEMHQ